MNVWVSDRGGEGYSPPPHHEPHLCKVGNTALLTPLHTKILFSGYWTAANLVATLKGRGKRIGSWAQ